MAKRRKRSDPTQPPPQLELLPVEHRGLHPRRLRSFKAPERDYHPPPNSEAFYAAEWRKWNDGKSGGGGSGSNALHYILCPEALQDKGHRTVAYSRRDAVVAATVIQWLGTNIGRGFVREVEDKIRAATDRQHELRTQRRRASRTDERTPLKRRKETLDAARARLDKSTKGGK